MASYMSTSYPPPNLSAIEAYLSPSFEKSNARDRAHQLVSQAYAFFKEIPPAEPIACNLKQVKCYFGHADLEDLFEEIFIKQNFSGVCIGDRRHTHLTPKKLLIDLIPLWKTIGITTFFLEHIKSGAMQKDLDKCFKTGQWKDLPARTAKSLERLDKRFHLLSSPYSYTNLIKAFIQAGIPVVGIDSDTSAIAGCYEDLPAVEEEERIPALNYTAKQIMDEQIKQLEDKGIKAKSLILVGSKHGSKMSYLKFEGISGLFPWPLILVSDAPEYKQPEVHFNPESLLALGYHNETAHAVLTIEKPEANFSPRRNTL